MFIQIPNADQLDISVSSVFYGNNGGWVELTDYSVFKMSGGILIYTSNSNVRGCGGIIKLTINI